MKYIISLISVILLSGCSVGLALNQPDWKDVNKIIPGSNIRYTSMVLGTPYVSEQKLEDGSIVYFYNFRQGYKYPVKMIRATGHFLADFMTLCLWEVIGTPIEMIFTGADKSLQVITNTDGVIIDVLYSGK